MTESPCGSAPPTGRVARAAGVPQQVISGCLQVRSDYYLPERFLLLNIHITSAFNDNNLENPRLTVRL